MQTDATIDTEGVSVLFYSVQPIVDNTANQLSISRYLNELDISSTDHDTVVPESLNFPGKDAYEY